MQELKLKMKNGEMHIKIKSKNNFSIDNLTQNEIDIINHVIKVFKNKKVKDISDMSHKEEGWNKTALLNNISFKHAMNLQSLT